MDDASRTVEWLRRSAASGAADQFHQLPAVNQLNRFVCRKVQGIPAEGSRGYDDGAAGLPVVH